MEPSDSLHNSMSSDSLVDSTLWDSSVDFADSSPENSPKKKKAEEGGGFRATLLNNGAKLLNWGWDTASSVTASTTNFLYQQGEQGVTSLLIGQLNKGIENEELSEDIQQTLKYLDKSGKLPRIINKFIRRQITPEFMKKSNLGGNIENLQKFLDFLVEQAVSSLACYRPYYNLPISVINNFISIINSWMVKSGLQEKLRICKCLRVTTLIKMKSKTDDYNENICKLSQIKGSNAGALDALKKAFDNEIAELLEKLSQEEEEFVACLDENIPKLVTTIFEVTKISEDYGLQHLAFKTLQIRSKLEKNLLDFIGSFYFKALPRKGEAVKEPLLQCMVSTCAKPLLISDGDDGSEYYSALSEDEFRSLDFSNSTYTENKSENDGYSLGIQGTRPNNTNTMVIYHSEEGSDEIPDAIFLDEIVEPQLPLLQSGILGIIEVFLFNYTKSLREEEPRKKAVESVSGLLTEYGISEVDDWIEDVLIGIVSENSLIAQLRSAFVECLAYRFVEVFEQLAILKPRVGLDVLESLLLNTIDLAKGHLPLQEDFSDTIQEYKNLVILDEAYGWRDHFLLCELQIASDTSDDPTTTSKSFHSSLRSFHVQDIFRLSKCSDEQIYALAVVLKIPLPEGNFGQICAILKRPVQNPLIDFFRQPRKAVQDELQMYLTKHFGQFAEAILKATGLDKDNAIGFCDIFQAAGVDLGQIRSQAVPRILLDAYCMVADLEKRPLQRTQDQILIRFTEEYSKQERSDKFDRDSFLFGNLIRAFDERRFLKDDEVMLFSEKLAQAGYNWFSAVNYYMQQQLEAPDGNEEKLKVLDPNNNLPRFCGSLRDKILVESKKKIVKALKEANVPYHKPAYAVVDENEEIQTFAKLYLDSILSRILTKLACEWNECQLNGLFSNILKMTLYSIQGSCNWDVFDGPATTKALLKAIGIENPSDLHLIVLPFGNGKIEKMAFDEVKKLLPLLINELCSEFFILNQNQANFERIIGHRALEIDAAKLSENIIPMAFRWMGEEKNRKAFAHVIKDLLDENEIEEIDRAWIEELLVGTALLEYDKWALIRDAYERRDQFLQGKIGEGWKNSVAGLNSEDVGNIFDRAPAYDKKKRKALLNAVKGPDVKGQEPRNDHDIFIEFFRKDGRREAEEQIEIHAGGKDQVQNLWGFFEKILAPRLFRVFEHAANYHPESTGNILERILVNSISVIQDAFLSENAPKANQFKAAVIEYERLSLLVEAYDWRNRYLKDVKGVKAASCEKAAQHLIFDEIKIILEGNFDKDRLKDLLKAVGMLVDDDVDIVLEEEPLLKFFRSSSQEVRNAQRECLSKSFGPVAKKVLELTGLTSDAAFSLPGASKGNEGYYTLEVVRTQLVPQILLNFYKDMSDFYGVHEKNLQIFEEFFDEHNKVATQILKTFANISTEKAKTYVRENAGDIATMVSTLFPTASLTQIRLLTNAIRGIVSADPSSKVNSAVEKVINFLIEERLYGSLIQFVVSLIIQEGEIDSSEEDPLNDLQTGFGTFLRRRLPGLTGSPEHPKNPSGMKPKDDPLKQDEDPRPIFSNMWFSNILQCFGDIFEGYREDLKIGMREYFTLEERLRNENLPDSKKEERKAKKLKAVFHDFTQELILISGLNKRHLYLPEFCQEDIWDNLTEDVLPLFFAKFYIEMTVSQNAQKAEADVLRETLPHGPGAATGFAHFIMQMLESQMAIDGNGMGKALHTALIDFFMKSGTDSGKAAAQGLGKEEDTLIVKPDDFSLSDEESSEELPKSQAVQSSLNEIISVSARSKKLTAIFAAIERYVASPLQRMLGEIKTNLASIDKNPDVLTKIAKDCILDAGEHFMRLHSVALKENKESAYELVDSPSTLLEGMSLDRPISEYILLKEKRKKAEAIYRAAAENADAWYLTETMRAERKVTQEAALESVKETRRAVRRYARTVWNDQRDAVEEFLEAERKLSEAAREEASTRDRLSDNWMYNLINSVSDESLRVAQEKRHTAELQLDEARNNLQRVTIDVIGGQDDAKANPLINLCSSKEYRQRRKILEEAQKELESKKNRTHNIAGAQSVYDEAFKNFEQYRIDAYFTPLAAKILKLVGDKPFNDLDFPTALPESIKETMIEQIKGNLPEILNMLFHNLVKPETQQGILLKFVRDANKATSEKAKKKKSVEKEVVVDEKEEIKKQDANGFEDRSGKMALHLIDMLPKGSLEIFHRLSAVKEAIEEGGGKYIADSLSSSLEETSMVQLFDSLLELAVASSMPDGIWDDHLALTPNMKPLPTTPEELDAAKRMNVRTAQNIKRELQDELTIFMENEIASQIMAPLEKAGSGFLGGVSAFIHSVFDGETADDIFKVFEEFAHNVYNLFHALMSFIASVTFWPVARWFIGTMPQDITETFSLEAHENLVFQWVNVVMDTIDEELGMVQVNEKDVI